MATNSKAELLNWLKEPGRLLGNDMVFAIDKAKADALLTQEYIKRFKTTSYLPPVSGETAADNGYKVYMQNFVLDHPRLSFDNVDITSSKASLRMKIVGGNQVDLKQAGAHWYPRRIDSLDPLVGPELSLKLELSDVPGYVDDDGRIILDLRNSDNFVLTFSDSNRIRQLGGDFFKELFRALPVEKRVWSLGAIERGPDELLQPESFRLHTQRNPSAVFAPAAGADQPDVDGAVLGLVRMVGNDGQQTVVPGPGYRYLIPSDSAQFTATVLFEKKRTMLAAFLRSLPRGQLREAAFDVKFLGGGDMLATATSGWMELSSGAYSSSYEGSNVWPTPRSVYCEMDIVVPAFRVNLKDNLVVMLSDDRIDLQMITQFVADIDVVRYEELGYSPSPHLNPQAIEVGWEGDFVLEFRAGWTLESANGGVIKLQDFYLDFEEVIDEEHWPRRREPLPPDVEVGTSIGQDHAWFVFAGPLNAFSTVAHERSFPALRAALAKDLSAVTHLSDAVEQTVQLTFGEALVPSEQHLPRDVATFGHVNPRLTAFTVTPLESTLIQGSKLQFATVPAKANITWSAESIEGSSDAPGSFDKAMYQAPPASGIQGDFTRVRITATDPSTGYRASALVSVVKNALGLSPLVEVCQVGDAGVSLKAGHVGQAELRWTVLGSAPHGHLAHATGQSNTYIPGGNLTGKAFVVEQVEVRNSQTNEQRTLCMITQMTDKRPEDVVIVKQDPHSGQVWLVLSTAGVTGVSELSVVYGPGTCGEDAAGLYYQADSASTAPFCVVRASWAMGPFLFEGFIVLPLPLSAHSAAYQPLEQAGQHAIRRLTGTTA
ncbi:hypothetical protein N5F23_13930 [Pseudomonas sichuanensis]|uniref:hypothetical protein n=1 Tax=Pseudomonas sichuanensis TaxID=2213015 RepID=UPI00244CBA82|nr:hypothetical protein [Pseudomonas sichuanensis]MDH0730388.1 hypothetical protein [Pseudomonas sichuanensis]MDH1583681.1 hypothetical protein [Pseudomonas sichuanensis]MDH1594228.1 hypothetical protein [Pseudomonas sichuanensis]MDH1597853.1 hypothetical protein [Pseudomonas sichuanensis]